MTYRVEVVPSAEKALLKHSYAASCETDAPAWITPEFIDEVRERMRQLVGRWKATPCGGTLELVWS